MALSGTSLSSFISQPSIDLWETRRSRRKAQKICTCQASRRSTANSTRHRSSGIATMKFLASSLSSKDMKRHLREKKSVEGQILRATPEPELTPTLQSSQMSKQTTEPRKRFFGLTDTPSLSTGSSPHPSEPKTPDMSISTVPNDTRDWLPTYSEIRASVACTEVTDKDGEVHPDFMGLWLDGTPHWANPPIPTALDPKTEESGCAREEPREKKAAGDEPTRRSSHKDKRPKINLIIPENHHSKSIVALRTPSAPEALPRSDPLAPKKTIGCGLRKQASIDSVAASVTSLSSSALSIPDRKRFTGLRRVSSMNTSMESICLGLGAPPPIVARSPLMVNSRSSNATPTLQGLTGHHISRSASTNPKLSQSANSHERPKPKKSLRPFSRAAPITIAVLHEECSQPMNEALPASKSLGFGSETKKSDEVQRSAQTSSSTTSSDEGKDDDRSCYSKRSSISSVDDDANAHGEYGRPLSTTGSVAFSIISPARAGVLDESQPPMPTIPLAIREKYGLRDLDRKPLPPEPTDLEMAPGKPSAMKMEPEPLKPGGQPPSRTISKGSAPQAARSASPSLQPLVSAMIPRKPAPWMTAPGALRNSLTSKYSTNELDALDQAFQLTQPLPVEEKNQAMEELELELEIHLSTISEDAISIDYGSCRADSPVLNEHFQIPRVTHGPIVSQPSRSPPVPPVLPAAPKPSKGSRRSLRLSAHVANQLRPLSPTGSMLGKNSLSRHSSVTDASAFQYSTKAQKFLGRTSPIMMHERRHSRSLPHSPNISVDAAEAKPDPAILEVHHRLAILQMTQNVVEEARARQQEPLHKRMISKASSRSKDALSRKSSQKSERVSRWSLSTAASVYQSMYPPPPIPDFASEIAERRSRPKSTATVRSLCSIAVSDIPDMYANMPSSQSAYAELRAQQERDGERTITPSAAEAVLLRILESLDNLQDLFSAAVVSKGFYRTFKRHELRLMKSALRSMSPAAWELREITPPVCEQHEPFSAAPMPEYTPSTYLNYYTRDLYTMVALKSLILDRCAPYIRAETRSALAGEDDRRSLELDDAFWRVWTFCKIFGSGKGREYELSAQLDWLRGGVVAHAKPSSSSSLGPLEWETQGVFLGVGDSFGRGNAGGLEAREMCDMAEVWMCLGVLIKGLLREEKRCFAREFGVFAPVEEEVIIGGPDKEKAVLEEWTHHLLTLGPSAILELATPASLPGKEGFLVAAEHGWTAWTPPPKGMTRATFLRDAVTRVYDERTRAGSPSRGIRAVGGGRLGGK